MVRGVLIVAAALLAGTVCVPVADALWRPQDASGRIACAVGHMSASNDLCSEVAPHESAQSRIAFEPPAGIAFDEVVFELRWEAAMEGVPSHLSLYVPRPETETYGVDALGQWKGEIFAVSGSSPLRVRITASGAEPLYVFPPSGTVDLVVRPSITNDHGLAQDPTGLGGASGLVWQQDFQLAATWIHHETMASNFSVFDPSTWPAAAPPPEEIPEDERTDDEELTTLPPPVVDAPSDETPVDPGLQESAAAVAPDPKKGQRWVLYAVSGSSLAGLLVAGLLGRPRLAVLIPLFSRLSREVVLDHPIRATLEAVVRTNPGIMRGQARSLVAVSRGSFDHHSRVLERHRLLVTKFEFGRARLYPPQNPTAKGAVTVPARLLELLRTRPGLRPVDAARSLGIAEDTLGYHAKWLARRGLLDRRRENGAVRYYRPTP